ncbi:hypothetical protein B0H13DRAFT_1857348 [Mycena leptocephala]|nr:hypothetical protein B0H13DRAFT_1857348 [Mycena leptocephala]
MKTRTFVMRRPTPQESESVFVSLRKSSGDVRNAADFLEEFASAKLGPKHQYGIPFDIGFPPVDYPWIWQQYHLVRPEAVQCDQLQQKKNNLIVKQKKQAYNSAVISSRHGRLVPHGWQRIGHGVVESVSARLASIIVFWALSSGGGAGLAQNWSAVPDLCLSSIGTNSFDGGGNFSQSGYLPLLSTSVSTLSRNPRELKKRQKRLTLAASLSHEGELQNRRRDYPVVVAGLELLLEVVPRWNMLRYVAYLIEEQHVHGNKTDLTKETKGSGVSARATARTELQVKGEKYGCNSGT